MSGTPPDYEAEYNNRARVPEHPEIIAGWARDAAAYRDRRGGTLDIAYGDHPRQVYDLFRADGERRPVTVIFLHGGYWQGLDKSYFSHMAAGMNARGFDVAIPSYRLCPEVRIGDIVLDIAKFAIRLENEAGGRRVVAGHSAGGHLAARLLAAAQPQWQMVDAAMPISGLFDLVPLVHTSINEKLGLDERQAAAEGIAAWPPPPPGMRLKAFVGERESAEYHRQTQFVADSWGEAGVETSAAVVPGADHFTVVASLAEPDGLLTRALASLAADRPADVQ